jgi:GNAT superfamily N-acetyltransferase
MSHQDTTLRDAIDAYLHASLLLETIVPGCVVDDIDGLRHICFGRPKAGVHHEIIAGDRSLADVVSIVGRHPGIAPVFVSTFAPLRTDRPDTGHETSVSHVVRNTLMTFELPDVAPFADPTLRRLTAIDELRSLARIRGDKVLDVDFFTDAICCFILDIDGDPVSSALLIPSTHGAGVVEHVYTLASYRRRGYGRWLLRALHAEAIRMGLRRIVLGSNDAGLPLYQALGYQALCYQDVFLVG